MNGNREQEDNKNREKVSRQQCLFTGSSCRGFGSLGLNTTLLQQYCFFSGKDLQVWMLWARLHPLGKPPLLVGKRRMDRSDFWGQRKKKDHIKSCTPMHSSRLYKSFPTEETIQYFHRETKNPAKSQKKKSCHYQKTL